MNMNTLKFKECIEITQIKNETKEEFFSIKRISKRLKTSSIFSETDEFPTQTADVQILPKTKYILESIKQKCQSLASTIASDHFLTFRNRQPRRKKNKKTSTSVQITTIQQSQSEERTLCHFTIKSSSMVHNQDKISMKEGLQALSNLSAQNFIFIKKIGEGTYSQVFKAIERRSGFLCSIKVLNKEIMRNLKVQQNIFRQIKIQSFLNHPNIVKLYGTFHDTTSIYLICQLATDENVYENLIGSKMKGNYGLPLETVSNYIGQLCSAIEHLHSNCIIHRDIKPQNILITCHQTIKLCDFGWSVYNPEKGLRSTLCGTPLYLAPQLIKQNAYTEAVDVWAMGILTYQLLTSEIPFKIRNLRQLSKVITSQINYFKIKCPQAIDFIEKSLMKQQYQRKSIHQLMHHSFLKLGQYDQTN